MIQCGANGPLKHNFHKKIGGQTHQINFKRKTFKDYSHREAEIYEEERFLDEKKEREEYEQLMALPDKNQREALKFASKILSETN